MEFSCFIQWLTRVIEEATDSVLRGHFFGVPSSGRVLAWPTACEDLLLFQSVKWGSAAPRQSITSSRGLGLAAWFWAMMDLGR